MGAPFFVACGAFPISVGGTLGFMPLHGAGAGECARRRSNFLLLRQKKVTKEKATPLSASPALRYGATCGARGQGALRNSLRACGAPLKQPQRVSSRSACVLRHTRHPARCAPRRIQRGKGNQTSTRAFASLGPACAARGACARETRPSAAMARTDVGCSAVRLPHPCWLRLRRGGCGVSMGVEAPMLRALTRRGCLNEAATQRSEVHGAPHNRHAAGLPLRTAKGSQTGGRLSFGYFSLAKQRKGPRPPGRLPASALNRGMRFNQRTKTNTTKSIATTAYPTSASSQKPLKQARKPSAPKK